MFSSIKMKITFAVFALVMLSMSATALMVNYHHEKNLKKTIFNEQNTLLVAAARHIDEYLFEALVYLDDTADLVTPEMIASPMKAQRFLDNRKAQQSFYDSALVVFDRSGTVIAASPAASNPIGENFSHREYFQETVRTGKMVISQPFLSAQKQRQIIVMFTSPLYDAQGKVAGVLGGAVSIQKQRYLQSLRSHKLGRSGYLSLYDSSGKAIMHPVPRLLLTTSPPDSPVGRGLKGYEGTEESVAEDGKTVIRSVRRLQATDWVLAVTSTVEEAYAPLYTARKYLLLAGVLASALSALAAWHLINALLAPLSAFTQHLKEPATAGVPVPVPIRCNDEIRVLSEAFNAMICGMEESAEKIARLSRVIEQCPYTVVIAALDGTIEYANPLISGRGLSVEEVTGRNLRSLVPGCRDGAAMRQAIEDAAEWQGEIVRKGSGGGELWEQVSLSRLTTRRGEAMHLVAIFNDITSRKEAEQALRLSEALHRQIFEENPQPMWVYDTETLAFLAVNNAAVRHYGYSSAEFLSMTIVDIRPPCDVPSLLAELAQERAGFHDAGVWQHLRKDGAVIHVSITSHPLDFLERRAEIVLVHDVTAQKAAENELRLSEERYRNIFDGVGDIIFSVAPDSSFVSLNRAFEEIIGWPPAEWIGRSFRGLFLEEELPQLESAFRACLAGEAVRNLEYRVHTRSGEVVCLGIDATPRLEEGRVIQVQGIARDITERRLAQQKQEYLQRRLSAMWNIASMVDGHPDALQEMVLKEIVSMTRSRCGFMASVIRSSNEITLHSWSADEAGTRAPRTFPLERSGILGKVISCRSALIDNDYAGTGSPPVSAPGVPPEANRIVAVPILMEGEVVAVYAATGKKSGYTGMDAEHMSSFLKNVQIILEKRRAEQSLVKLSHAINQNPVSVVITDAAGRIEFVNPRFTEVTGYELAEVLGKRPSFLSAEQKPGQEAEHLWETLTAGKVWNGIFLNRKKNGEVFWGRATITSIRNKDNEITNYLGINEDITERLQLEQQLRQSQKMEALGTLTGGIAHDFNNILTSIAAYCALLEKVTPPDEGKKRHYLEKVMESTARASALTRSLLAYSRKQPLNKQVIDVNDVLGDLERLLSPVIGEDVEFRVVKNLAPMPVLADRHQLEQVLMNLSMNARDAMPEGGVLEIEVERVSSDDQTHRVPGYLPPASYIRLSVSDTGTGIDGNTRERIFEPFFTTKAVDKGTGLGLSIVYGIVNQHQGYLDVDSEVGRGSVFSIYLPVACEEAVENTAAAARGEGRCFGTILLAEDEGDIRAPLKELLEGKGYTVIEAADGEEAIAKYRTHSGQVQLVILDVVMPRKNGRQAYEEMRRITPDMKVLFISGYTSDILSSKGFTGDDINFIAKPIAIDPLLLKITEVLPHGR